MLPYIGLVDDELLELGFGSYIITGIRCFRDGSEYEYEAIASKLSTGFGVQLFTI